MKTLLTLILLCAWIGAPPALAATAGSVVAWGDNTHGQTTIPAGLSGVTAIAAGAIHTVVLKNNGTVVAWGYNAYGQTNVPAGLTQVIAVSAGDAHSLAVKANGFTAASLSPAARWAADGLPGVDGTRSAIGSTRSPVKPPANPSRAASPPIIPMSSMAMASSAFPARTASI